MVVSSSPSFAVAFAFDVAFALALALALALAFDVALPLPSSASSPQGISFRKISVIPTGAERSEAEWRDLSWGTGKKGPSTSPPLWGGFARDDGVNWHYAIP